ncbi:MAG TPA: iron-containing alcohol dehydrogenase [Candidatus Latescibacteria bacterium]|nr:iron-containing alcohol dehydrogenase [Candidatus Latescibacterota bacterium]
MVASAGDSLVRQFEFATASRIVFGRGRANEIGSLASDLAGMTGGEKRAFLIIGMTSAEGNSGIAAIPEILRSQGFHVAEHRCSGEPTVSVVRLATAAGKEHAPHVVVAVGGGSVLDTGKAVAALLSNAGDPEDYLEGVGTGRTFERPAVPLIAVPTTAGTGSEVTRNAVVKADDGSFKKSMRSAFLLPKCALVDSNLTHSLPERSTTYTGMDALTQLIEAFTSNAANPLTDCLAIRGIQLVATSLERVVADGSCADARDDMSLAALLSGICLANAGLGAVHGLVAPLGARFSVPHGAGCAALLAPVIEANSRALRRQGASHPCLEKYRTVEEAFALPSRAANKGLAQIIRALVTDLRVPGLRYWGVSLEAIPDLVKKSRGGSMRYNPVELGDEELATIIEAAL